MVDYSINNNNPIKVLKIGYVAALLIIAIMSACIHFFLDQVIAEQDNTTLVVSSRQAKLSQRVALYAGHYVTEPNAIHRAQLLNAVELMRDSHERLTTGDLGGGKLPEHIRVIYYKLPYRLDEYMRAYIAEAEALLDDPERQLSARNAHYAYIVEASKGPLLTALDAVVEAYEQESALKIAQLHSYQRIALFIIMATLVAEALLIFMPLIRRVERYANKLEGLAATDPLTGVNNYRSFMAKGAKEIKRSIRLSKPLSVCVMDLDHFKAVNDKYGHNAGDIVLKEFAEIVLKCLRLEDDFGRIGGEEFALLLPHTKLSDAHTVAERIRRVVEISPVRIESGQEIYITTSIGVAEANPQALTINPVMTAADDALYEAKKQGRNRVVLSEHYSSETNVVSLDDKRK